MPKIVVVLTDISPARSQCQLSTSAPHQLTLHLAPSPPALLSTSPHLELKPYAIEYASTGALALGSDGCPLERSSSANSSSSSAVDGVRISVVAPGAAPVPPLRQPPPVREDGTPEPPKVEKSFVAKYWMYIVPCLLLLALPGDGAGGGAEGDQSSSRAPNAGQAARRVK